MASARRLPALVLPYSWVAWVFLAAFALQVGLNITSEIAGTSSLADRLGFIVMFVMGGVLMIRGLKARTILVLPLLLALAFAMYNALGIALTGDGPMSSLSTIFIPRYGYFVWMLVGLFAHLAISEIEVSSATRRRRMHILAPGIAIASLVLVLRDYIIDPLRSDSYQFAAMNAAMLLLLATLALDRWRMSLASGSTPMSIGVLLYILGGSGVVYSVALMGATSIVLIWLAIVTLWALYINVVLGPVWRVLLILMVFGAAAWFVANVLDDFLLLTRFQAVETEGLFISSVTSRLDLLPTFNKQFAISPVFGHSYAEMLAGYERGDYVHSVPLSLLSHAGVVGFAFFALMFIALIAKQPTLATSATSAIKQSEKMKRRVFTLVFLIGCAVAFFSWLPLWFMMGYLMVVEPAYSRGLVGHEQN